MGQIKSLVFILLSLLPMYSYAEGKNFGYYGLEPDIITNYVTNKKKMGYLRVTIDLMLYDVANQKIIEHHTPLLRDAIIHVLSKQTEAKVRSLDGREKIRQACTKEVKKLLKKETGHEIIKDVLFTKYLYQ